MIHGLYLLLLLILASPVWAFPTTPVRDVFTGTDGTDLTVYDGTNWGKNALVIEHEIQGNAATDTVDGTSAFNYWKTQFTNNQEVYLTVSTKPPDGNYADVGVFVDPADATFVNFDGYVVRLAPVAGTDGVQISRVDNGASTQLGATISQEFTAGDKLGLERRSNDISAFQFTAGSWTSLGTRTDATYTGAKYLGFGSKSTTTRMDDFGGGDTVECGAGSNYFLLNDAVSRIALNDQPGCLLLNGAVARVSTLTLMGVGQ